MSNDRNHESLGDKVCSAEHAGVLDNWLRRLLQNPDKILRGLITDGQTAIDVGCGPGVFTLAMAKLAGEKGCVIAADLQQEMLDKVRAKAREAHLESRIRFHKCESDKIGLDTTVDFALAFYMVHEVPDPEAFLREIYSFIKPGGKLFLVEPKFHVSASAFAKTVDLATKIGFKKIGKPRISFSRAVLLFRQ